MLTLCNNSASLLFINPLYHLSLGRIEVTQTRYLVIILIGVKRYEVIVINGMGLVDILFAFT